MQNPLFSKQVSKEVSDQSFEHHKALEDLCPWKVALIDDEDDIIKISEMVLKRIEVDDRPLEFLTAHSAEEAKRLFEEHSDIAIAVVDVVMEDDHAGLDLVKWIRENQKNTTTRLVLRTGQPGQAPEEDVIRDYDINDYKNKTELNATRLKTVIYAAIRSYRDIKAVETSNKGLENVVGVTTDVLQACSHRAFCARVIHGVNDLLGQHTLVFSLHYRAHHPHVGDEQIVMRSDGARFQMDNSGKKDILDPFIHDGIDQAFEQKMPIYADNTYFSYIALSHACECVAAVTIESPLDELTKRLLNVLLTKVSIIFENLTRREDVERTQQELMIILGEAIEQRSKETGSHVRRVSLISEFLAQRLGLDEDFVQLIKFATPMHDIGKIAIAEHILHKPAKLDSEEWAVMQTHAQIGHDLLSHSKRALLQVGGRIALFHHEKWDGTGYPKGLAGEDIPIEGRIMAVADVIDALAARRSYKEPWPSEDILAYLKEQRGGHFDPQICDLAIEHFDKIMALRSIYPD